jgi:hypothetical protein
MSYSGYRFGVADWSQAEIGYTSLTPVPASPQVAHVKATKHRELDEVVAQARQ